MSKADIIRAFAYKCTELRECYKVMKREQRVQVHAAMDNVPIPLATPEPAHRDRASRG